MARKENIMTNPNKVAIQDMLAISSILSPIIPISTTIRNIITIFDLFYTLQRLKTKIIAANLNENYQKRRKEALLR